MARTISTKLMVEGENQYKAALKNCNNELKLLKSSLEVASSEFKNNANSTQALTAKGEILNQMYAAQEKKLEAMKTVLASAQKAQNTYTDEIEDYKKKLATAQDELDNLKNSTGDTTDEQEKLRKKIAELSAGLEKATTKQQSAKNAVDTYKTAVNYAQRDLNNLNAEIKKNDQYLDEAANSADGCATSIDEYGKETKQASEESEQFGDKSTDAVNALAGALAAAGIAATIKEIAGELREAVTSAQTFESGMAEVFTLMPDLTSAARQQMSDDMRMFATELNVTTQDAIPGLYQAISASVPADNVFDFLATAQKAAVGGVSTLETSVDGLTTVVNAYGDDVIDVQKASDIMFTTVKLGKTTFGELSSSLFNVLSEAKAANVGFEDLGAALSTMTSQGVPTAQATTRLRQMLVELGDSASDVNADFQEIAGKSFKEFIASGKNTQDALLLLEQYAKDTGVGLNELFSSTEAGGAALLLTGKATQKFTDDLIAMENAAGATDTAYATMAETSVYQSKRVEVASENLKLAIGKQLLPEVNKLSNLKAGFMEWATDIVEKNPWLVKAITILAASVGVVTGAIVAYVAITKIANIVTETLSTTMGKSPWGAIAIAVGAVVTALTLLVAATNNSKTAADELNESLAETKKAYEESIAGIEEEEQTTLGMISTLQKLTAKEEKTAADKQLILDIVEKLNEALPELNLAYDEQTDSVNYTTEALRKLAIAQYEAAKQQENLNRLNELYVEQYNIADAIKTATEEFKKYEAEYRRLQSIPNHGTREIPQDLYAAQAAYLDAKIELEKLTKSQTENDAEIARLEESYNNYINTLGAAVEEQEKAKAAVENAQESIKNLEAEIATLEESYQSAYEKAYDTLTEQMGLFAELDGSAKKSIDDLIKSLESQIKFMDDYADNIALAMERGVDDGLIKKLSNGSEESAQILAAIVAGSDDKIKELNEKLGSVEEGKEEFSSAVAEMQTNFSVEMDKLEGRMDEAVDALDQAEEAKKAAQNTIQGAIDGVISKETAYKGKYKQLAKMGLEAYENELEIKSPSRKFEQAGKYAVEGNIKGVEEKIPDFEKQYRELAKKGLEAITYEIPSSTSVASPADQTSAKIVELIGMIRGGTSGGAPVTNNYGPAQDVNVFQVGDEIVTHAVKNRVSAGINTDYEAIRRASGYGD